jgi:DNA-binding LytR/AlgR family response regulator
MYRVAIVEDNAKSAEKLKRYLKRFSQERNIPIQYSVFVNGIDFISDYKADFDVVLMDIEMPHMDGMTAARKLRKIDEEVCLIFVTNLAHYAIEGYEVRAMDFLVKPVEYVNFSLKLQKALASRSRMQKKEIVLSSGSGFRRIRLDELYYIEVMDHNLIYHTTGGDFSERGSIREKEENLKDFGFARASNSFLVNLRYATAFSGGDITVAGIRIPVGRTKKKDFLKKLTEYLGDSFQ